MKVRNRIMVFISFFACQIIFSQVGIGTTTTNAQLDVVASNTVFPTITDGLLIPKVENFPAVNPTTNQDGLLIFLLNTIGNNQSGFYYWDTVLNKWNYIQIKKHYIGEEFGGGIIFYLYEGADGIQHGLIVSKYENNFVKWQTTPSNVGADRTWDGAYNTSLLTNSPVANYVNSLTEGGFTDWYLPSIDELSLLYHNRFAVNNILYNNGYTLLSHTLTYWTSNERADPTQAQVLFFYSGHSYEISKTVSAVGRAIRKF